MKYYMDDCQNETHHRCAVCGEPVCWQHGEETFATVFPLENMAAPYPMLKIKEDERVCSECANGLREEHKQALEAHGVA